jgi:hypothetical protein
MGISKGLNPVMILVGAGAGLIVLGIFNQMTILGDTNSANLASGTSTVSQGLPLVGVGVFLALTAVALKAANAFN